MTAAGETSLPSSLALPDCANCVRVTGATQATQPRRNRACRRLRTTSAGLDSKLRDRQKFVTFKGSW